MAKSKQFMVTDVVKHRDGHDILTLDSALPEEWQIGTNTVNVKRNAVKVGDTVTVSYENDRARPFKNEKAIPFKVPVVKRADGKVIN